MMGRFLFWPSRLALILFGVARAPARVDAGISYVIFGKSSGFDAEIGTPLDDELTPIVCSPEEMADCSHLPSPMTGDWPKLAFSAKESIYKCVDPVRREFLDFLDVRVRFGIDASRSHGTFEVAPLRSGLILPVIGRWAVDAERVYAGACWPHH